MKPAPPADALQASRVPSITVLCDKKERWNDPDTPQHYVFSEDWGDFGKARGACGGTPPFEILRLYVLDCFADRRRPQSYAIQRDPILFSGPNRFLGGEQFHDAIGCQYGDPHTGKDFHLSAVWRLAWERQEPYSTRQTGTQTVAPPTIPSF